MEKNKPVPVSVCYESRRVVSRALREAAETGVSRVRADYIASRVGLSVYCMNFMREIGAKASVKRVGDYYEITRKA